MTNDFEEIQRLPLRRIAVALAIPPCSMLVLLIWQAWLGHPWGKNPMSNTSLTVWTVFLWLIYFRLLTVRLVTQVGQGELRVAMRGLWRTRRVLLKEIQSAEVMQYDPVRDFGGYGIRKTARATAYIADGDRGVRVKLTSGATLVVGSQRPADLAGSLLKPRAS